MNLALHETSKRTTPQMYWSRAVVEPSPSPLPAGVGPAATSSRTQMTSWWEGGPCAVVLPLCPYPPPAWSSSSRPDVLYSSNLEEAESSGESPECLPYTRWILCGEASSSLIRLRCSWTSLSDQGIWLNPVERGTWCPRKSIHSFSWLGPITVAMLGILSAKGSSAATLAPVVVDKEELC